MNDDPKPEPIVVACPKCGHVHNLSPDWAGRGKGCERGCGWSFVVPKVEPGPAIVPPSSKAKGLSKWGP